MTNGRTTRAAGEVPTRSTARDRRGVASPFARIESVAGLCDHLQCAIELEHAILPAYLVALYSMDPERNATATEVLTSILLEEMLHLTLAANVLNAVGGRPRLDTPEMMPGYPRSLPHGNRSAKVSLLPFGNAALDQFLEIERPAPPGAAAQGDQYDTIGQFYDAIRHGLLDLCAEHGEAAVFCGDPSRQVTDALAYGGSGRIVAVDNLSTALDALREVVEQGEGSATSGVWDGDRDMFHPDRDEVAHFYRIEELALGRRYCRGDTPETGPTGGEVATDHAATRPVRVDQRLNDHPADHPIHVAQQQFNSAYSQLLGMLDRSFDGSPQTLREAVGVMYALKAQAQALMQMPCADGVTTAGPTFEYVPPSARCSDAEPAAAPRRRRDITVAGSPMLGGARAGS